MKGKRKGEELGTEQRTRAEKGAEEEGRIN
jgi:hypothetical protein